MSCNLLRKQGKQRSLAGCAAERVVVENNYLSSDQASAFDKEMTACRASGGNCQPIIDKYDSLNQKNRGLRADSCKANSLVCASYDKQLVDSGLDVASRPNWLYGSLDNEDVKNYILYNNSQDANYIIDHTDRWDRFGAFIGEPENLFGLVMGGRSLFGAATIGTKTIGAGLSMGANAGVQALSGNTGDKFDYLSFMASGITGIGGVGRSLNNNLQLNVGSAYFTSQIARQDSQSAMMGAAAGTWVGFGVGSAITSQWESKLIKDYFGMSASKNAIKYTDNRFGPGFIFKETELSPIPSILGGAGGALTQEATSTITTNGNK